METHALGLTIQLPHSETGIFGSGQSINLSLQKAPKHDAEKYLLVRLLAAEAWAME